MVSAPRLVHVTRALAVDEPVQAGVPSVIELALGAEVDGTRDLEARGDGRRARPVHGAAFAV